MNNYVQLAYQQIGVKYGDLQDDPLVINKDFVSDGMPFLFLFDRFSLIGEFILLNLDRKEDARLTRYGTDPHNNLMYF
eukprot:13124064-Heterocapsa_arctica.AAC.1